MTSKNTTEQQHKNNDTKPISTVSPSHSIRSHSSFHQPTYTTYSSNHNNGTSPNSAIGFVSSNLVSGVVGNSIGNAHANSLLSNSTNVANNYRTNQSQYERILSSINQNNLYPTSNTTNSVPHSTLTTNSNNNNSNNNVNSSTTNNYSSYLQNEFKNMQSQQQFSPTYITGRSKSVSFK